MEIKKVTLKDVKKIASLEHRVFKKNAFSEDLIVNLIENEVLFLKLETSNKRKKIIGFIIIIKDDKERANIINFLINPKFRNKGYGSYLLKKAIDIIKEQRHIRKIVLNVQISNSAAIKLYEKFKFKKNPKVFENYYQSGESAYLMELDINSL